MDSTTSTSTGRTVAPDVLREDLHGALERQEFRVYYQPIIGFDTAAVTGFEALLRWQHPQHGVLAPAQFIALAEDTGLLVPIGAAVLETACRQAAVWQNETGDGRAFAIGVNLSASQLVADDLLGTVVHALNCSGLDPSLLVLEITEATLVGYGERSALVLRDVAALGVQLCVDDFGAEHGSLRVLRELPVTAVKLDRSFLGPDAGDRMVGALATFAHALDVAVTAQGIDASEQFAAARALGCDRGQGRYFASPQPESIVQALVHHHFTWRAEHSAA
jgi:EAL domain-containing protein (putative c-di-GMP-specific phosphodiesterase class I)